MVVFRSINKTRAYVDRFKKKGSSIGLVPTMGCLHGGHLGLIRRARRENDIAVVSIFVNPTQFGPREDFKRYPRDIKRDERLLAIEGIDLLFYPTYKAMYPKGYRTYVNVEELSRVMCGASRPTHFRGVCTIVTKLFNIIKPDVAYFGEKDAQQAIIIKRMTADLNIDTKIKVLPIVREADGLAMSSRNIYLLPRERRDALLLGRSLRMAQEMAASGIRDTRKIKAAVRGIIKRSRLARIDYISIVEESGLREVKRLNGRTLLALAVRIGKTRLIDNTVLKV